MNHKIISDKYEALLQDMADIALMQRVINNSFKREFDVLHEYELQNSPSKIISHDAFGLRDVFTGALTKYAFRQTSIEELKKLTIWHKNSQYCWLVVQVYEKFEDFVFGVHDLLRGCKQDKPKLNRSLSYFSENYPELRKLEAKNASGIHLKIAVLMIEKLRHQIVHVQGNVENLDQFVKEVISDSGINNDKESHSEFIKQFVLSDKVYLLERPMTDDSLLPGYHDTYSHLVSYLAGYAGLVRNAVSLENIKNE